MSNLPKIHATCKAGCLWETVHKSDFEKSASIIQLNADESGAVTINPTQQQEYKIVSPRDPLGASKYACMAMLYYDEKNALLGKAMLSIDINEFDEYRDNFHFEVLSLTATETQLTFVYEINGNRYMETVTGEEISIANAELVFRGVTAVYLYNRYATIEAKIDKSDIEAAITTALNTEV